MKAAACNHVWWPRIGSNIEERAHKCKQPFRTREASPAAPLSPWSWPTAPWQCIHLEFSPPTTLITTELWLMLIHSSQK